MTDEPRRPRVLISAYACGPGDESEAGAGWAFACAAARHHDVVLVTRRRFRPAIDAALAADPELAAHLRVHDLELSDRVLRWKRRGADVYWYYALWQRAVRRQAARWHAEQPFDLAHHVTFAADWLPATGVLLPGVPVVWGPVGGATYLPWRMARWVGARGAIGELGRSAFTRACRRAFGDPVARRAAVVVAQNPDVARRFRRARRVVVESNCALGPVPATTRNPDAPARRAIWVGRLLPWKGGRLALAALARPELAGWHLDLYGTGPDRAVLESLAGRLGVADRVTFRGQAPRPAVLAALADADVLLFPSLHDSAGWAVGEAAAVGCAVVCLDIGGPPLLGGPDARVVRRGRGAVGRLAAAVVDAAAAPVRPYRRWEATRLTALVDDWYSDARTERGTSHDRPASRSVPKRRP